MSSRFYSFLLLITFIVLNNPSPSYACIMLPSAEEAYEEHDIVFTGKVIGCTTTTDDEYITFKVNKIWKGDKKSELTAIHKCSEKSFFKVGKQYLVYASHNENSEHINASSGIGNCSRTTEIISGGEKFLQQVNERLGNYSDNYQEEDFEFLGKPSHIFDD